MKLIDEYREKGIEYVLKLFPICGISSHILLFLHTFHISNSMVILGWGGVGDVIVKHR